MVGQAVAATRQIAYSRQLEMEADTLGARYMAAAGYDPKGTIGFLKTLDQERALNPIDVPAYIMTHPVTQERVANAELVVRSLGATQPRPDDPETLKKVQIIIRMERTTSRDTVVGEYEKLVAAKPAKRRKHSICSVSLSSSRVSCPKPNGTTKNLDSLRPNNPGLQRDLGRLYGADG